MPESNQLKILLTRAKNVCENKHEQVSDELMSAPSALFLQLNEEQTSLFTLMIQPASFEKEIPDIDRVALAAEINTIDQLDPSQVADYLAKLQHFLQYLKEEVALHLEKAAAEDEIKDTNLKAVMALSKMEDKITGRKRYFNNKGADLDDHVAYKNHLSSRDDYRTKLKKNIIEAFMTDVTIINGFRNDFIGLEDLTVFIKRLKKSTQFMDEKRSVADDTPIA